MVSCPITSWQIGENVEEVTDLIFLEYKSLGTVTKAMRLKDMCSWKKSYYKPKSHINKQRHHLADNGLYSQSYGFSSSHVWT